MRSDLGCAPSLLDFLANPDACDPHAFVRAFGNWLRAQRGNGRPNQLRTTAARHRGRSPASTRREGTQSSRSYKMVVLNVLLDDRPEHTQWKVEWIARKFTAHYLTNLEQLGDCSVLAGADAPETVPIGKIVSLLKSMPLKYLSNTTADFFTFDRGSGVFAVKSEVHAFWRDPEFRVC